MARIGDLRRLINLQARDTMLDSYGAPSVTWYNVAQLWAAMNPLLGRELLAAQALYTEVTSEITVRYDSRFFADPKAAAAMRIEYNGRLFDILGMVNVDERNHLVSLFCKEGVSDG